ncbi:hypothetical protein AV530_003669 [Patagioenas fasciata monilis]|uniref:Uncharacterized protein n=1 Tax=Patagioenas fasciata monilis TaxID=372326 RepID=A0A1V4KY24_PATFA|nr:hypothetical protein AV530_003669 [Patagioenas fasciata monilis]
MAAAVFRMSRMPQVLQEEKHRWDSFRRRNSLYMSLLLFRFFEELISDHCEEGEGTTVSERQFNHSCDKKPAIVL